MERETSIFKRLLVALAIGLPVALVPVHKALSTVSNQASETISALGDGSTVNFTIGFTFQSTGDVHVYLQDESATPYSRTEVLQGAGSTKFTITGTSPGTTIHMGTAPTSSQRLIIKREMAYTQTVGYSQTQAFPAKNHEAAMDKMTLLLQQLQTAVDQKVGLTAVTTSTTPTFPEPYADRFVLYNHAGDDLTLAPTEASSLSSGQVLKYGTSSWDLFDLDGALSTLTTGVASKVDQTVYDAHVASNSAHGATSSNTASRIVSRDASGNFSAGTITAALTGNASSATTATTATTAVNVSGTVGISNGGTGQTSAAAAFDALAPGTTKGDLISRSGSSNVRVAVGPDGSVLTADSTKTAGVNWVTSPPVTTADDSLFQVQDHTDTSLFVNFDAAGTTGTSTTIQSSQTTNRVITLPNATDTLVGKATTDTLTNKTISGGSNTLSNIPNSATTATAVKTNSAIVARDGSGAAALDVTGNLTGNVTGNVTGALTGNASTATSATTATNANNVATTQTTTNASYFPLMVASSTNSNQAPNLGTNFSFNPSTNILSLGAGGLYGSTNGTETVVCGMSTSSRYTCNNSTHAGTTFFGFSANSAYLFFGIGTNTNSWFSSLNGSATVTTPLTSLIPNNNFAPVFVAHNDSATANNYGAFAFSSAASDKITSAMVGVTEVHTAGSETGHLEFETRNAGTIATALKINADKSVVMGGYGVGVPVFDSTGLIASVAASTSGNVLTSNGTTWVSSASAAGVLRNYLLNSSFPFWQRGTSTTIANTGTAYEADRFYVKNSLGTNGVITYSQVAGVSTGAAFGASVKITTAPTALQTNGTEIYQVLENLDSLKLYNQTASFGVKVKALGNVNQVGLQFCYATSEAKCTAFIGSEVTCAVSSGSFAACSDLAQALGTSMTTSGSIGVRVRITTVSTGNTYDLNNGFVIEQPQVNLSSTLSAYQTAEATAASEFLACQRFYEKSYDPATAPGSVTGIGEVIMVPAGARTNHANWSGDTRFKVAKRNASSTMRLYCPDGASGGTGNSGCALANSVTDTTSGALLYLNTNSFVATNESGGSAGSLNGTIEFQWTADDEI